MSNLNQDSSKKSSSVLEKLGQKITNIKEDIADNIERRKQSHTNTNPIQLTTRTNMTDESSIIEKKPLTPPENNHRRTLGKNRKK
jgi:hypothetical protein